VKNIKILIRGITDCYIWDKFEDIIEDEVSMDMKIFINDKFVDHQDTISSILNELINQIRNKL